MKLRVIGNISQKELKDKMPEILMKAANAFDVVLVEKEPEWQEKATLPHTVKQIAKLEDWFFQQVNHELEDLKQTLVKKISGKQIKNYGIVGRTGLKPKETQKTTHVQLQKSRLALVHIQNMLINPGLSKRTKKQLYGRARQILRITEPKKRMELIDIFNEIQDLI